jgi:hypothetical protein
MVRQSITYNAVDSQAEMLAVLKISFTRCSVQLELEAWSLLNAAKRYHALNVDV